MAAGLSLYAIGAQAADIFYWSNKAMSGDAMEAALTASGHTIGSSSNETDFVTKLIADGGDLRRTSINAA